MPRREIFQYIEIDIDYCDLTYAAGACTAVLGTTGVRKCFNTSKTCQDIANFTKGVKTLRFCPSVSGIPVGDLFLPWLESVSLNTSVVNIAGQDKRLVGIGKRGTISAKVKDGPYHDRDLDKYQSERVDGTAQTDEGGYGPFDRGTFFGKLKNRFPYYSGRPMRRVDAYIVNGVIEIVSTRHYIITDINGPNSRGDVTIEGKDILDLASDDRTLFPKVSTGKLKSDITDTAMALTLIPTGVGDSEYPSSGRAALGRELVAYTRVGDNVTLTARGLGGTEQSSAESDDAFQQSYSVSKRRADLVIRDILDVAGIDPTFIPVAEWTAEFDIWGPSLFLTTDLMKPMGANKLLGELALLGLSLWWDDVNQKIGLIVNRPPDKGAVTEINDDSHIYSASQLDTDQDRLTEIAFFSVIKEAGQDGNKSNNYARQRYTVNQDVKNSDRFNDSKIRRIYTRWLNHGDDSLISILSQRMLKRFEHAPTVYQLEMDAEIGIGLADVIELTSRINQDDTGNPETVRMQVTKIVDKKAGHRIIVTAQSYRFDGRYGQIAENTRGDYTVATDDEKETGTYIVDETTLKFGDGTGPYVFI